jgi:hypothetical protein
MLFCCIHLTMCSPSSASHMLCTSKEKKDLTMFPRATKALYAASESFFSLCSVCGKRLRPGVGSLCYMTQTHTYLEDKRDKQSTKRRVQTFLEADTRQARAAHVIFIDQIHKVRRYLSGIVRYSLEQNSRYCHPLRLR